MHTSFFYLPLQKSNFNLMKKNTFILTLCLCCMALGMQAQHIPTLEEAVYGGLVRTEGGGYVNWMKDGEQYSKIERNTDGGFDGL